MPMMSSSLCYSYAAITFILVIILPPAKGVSLEFVVKRTSMKLTGIWAVYRYGNHLLLYIATNNTQSVITSNKKANIHPFITN